MKNVAVTPIDKAMDALVVKYYNKRYAKMYTHEQQDIIMLMDFVADNAGKVRGVTKRLLAEISEVVAKSETYLDLSKAKWSKLAKLTISNPDLDKPLINVLTATVVEIKKPQVVAKPVAVKKANYSITVADNVASPDALAFANAAETIVTNLAMRWEDEEAYEDINDYQKPLDKLAAKHGVVVTKMTKRPFGCHFTVIGRTYKLFITGSTYGYKRIK